MLAWHKSQLKELPMAKAGTIWESKINTEFFFLFLKLKQWSKENIHKFLQWKELA